MSHLNQNIRSGPPSDNINNPQNLYEYLIVGQNLKGNGAPSNTIGTIHSRYIDEVSGIEYLKGSDGTWSSFIDYSTLGPPEIPDPITVNQINTDQISQKTLGGDLAVNLGLTGSAKFTLGVGESIDINNGNVLLTHNGNGIFASDVQGYSLVSNQISAGKTITIDAATGIIGHAGAQRLEITNYQPNENLLLSTNGGSIDIVSGGAVNVTGTANVEISSAANSVTIDSATNLSLLAQGTSDILLTTSSGGGKIKMVDGLGLITFDAAANLMTCDNIDTTSINNSKASTKNQVLSVDTAGILSFLPHPKTFTFGGQNVGGNGTNYLTIGGNTTSSPADFLSIPIIDNETRIVSLRAALIYNVPWSWGGGTAQWEIFTCPTNLPSIVANTTTLVTSPMVTAGDLYFSYSPNMNVAVPNNVKLGVRLVSAGTASTSNTLDVIFTLGLQ